MAPPPYFSGLTAALRNLVLTLAEPAFAHLESPASARGRALTGPPAGANLTARATLDSQPGLHFLSVHFLCVPGFYKVPILGALFGNTENDETRIELIAVHTPPHDRERPGGGGQGLPERAERAGIPPLSVVTDPGGGPSKAMSQEQPTGSVRLTVPDALKRAGWLLNNRQPQEAVRLCSAVLSAVPEHVEALCLHGFACGQVGAFADAAASYRKAIGLRPDLPEAHNNLGNALRELRDTQGAITSYRKALALRRNYASAHNNLAVALAAAREYDEAVVSYREAVRLRPNFPSAYSNLGNALRALGRHDEAMASYAKAVELNPHDGNALMLLAAQRRQLCDWRDFAALEASLSALAGPGGQPLTPFPFLSFSDDPAKQLAYAKRFGLHWARSATPLKAGPERKASSRMRVAYLSADFHEHATAHLAAQLFEAHDRDRFDIHAVSFGPDADDAMRRRLIAAFDQFHDVRGSTDAEIAQLMRHLGIDIAVDLKGYTQDARPGILAHRPAPIQANYLGYPGSMGVDFIDYVLVDRFVVPPEQQAHFSETLVYLPGCYQVNDAKRPIAEDVTSRADCGLPGGAFVYCCFNNNYKITPRVFDVWMRLLEETQGSVLWLLKDNEMVERNLRREAEQRGIAGHRLIFAPRLPLAEHLARLRQADLVLDTFPYGAHTTASDALWAGVPVLSYAGRSFPSRVAGSLLNTIGLPELITSSLDEYENMARDLAQDPARLSAYRRTLAENRETSGLFDGERFARNLEAAFTAMAARRRDGTASEPGPLFIDRD